MAAETHVCMCFSSRPQAEKELFKFWSEIERGNI